jgi:hypothetical protein
MLRPWGVSALACKYPGSRTRPCPCHGLPGEVAKRPICVVSQNSQGTRKLQWKCRLDFGLSLATSCVWRIVFLSFCVFVESHPQPPAAIGGNGSIRVLWPSYARDLSGKLGKLQGSMDILLPWRLATSPGRPCPCVEFALPSTFWWQWQQENPTVWARSENSLCC